MTDAHRCTDSPVTDRSRCPDIRGPEDFRTSVSPDEWSRTGRCRYCQDLAFTATADVHGSPSLPGEHLRGGALFARSGALAETVPIPFTFGVPRACARARPPCHRACRTVARPARGDRLPWPLLETHNIGVATATGLDDPTTERFARCVVLIGFQARAMADCVVDCAPNACALPDRHTLKLLQQPASPTVRFETATALFGLDHTHPPRRGTGGAVAPLCVDCGCSPSSRAAARDPVRSASPPRARRRPCASRADLRGDPGDTPVDRRTHRRARRADQAPQSA